MSTVKGGGGYKALCPACGSRMRIRNSKEQTPTFRTMYAECTNIVCNHSVMGSLTWDYALSPSGLDSPRVVLPVAPSVKKAQAMRENQPQTNQLDLLDAVEARA